MTSEESIRRIKKLFKLYVEYEPHSEHYLYADAIKMSSEALEKQIPQKPKIVETDNEGIDMETLKKCTYKIYDAHCSKCDSLIGSEYDKFSEHYCDVCGQRIDWSCWQKN